jgi:hypothetical protein
MYLRGADGPRTRNVSRLKAGRLCPLRPPRLASGWRDSNARSLGSGPSALTKLSHNPLMCVPGRGVEPRKTWSWARRLFQFGHPGGVDNLGIEPSGRCLQDSTAHLCVAPRANGRTRTDSLRLTRAAHGPSVLRWQQKFAEPVAGLEPAASRLQGGCTSGRASPATVPSAGVEPALAGISGRCLSRWATWALPRLDSNQALDVQSVASYRIDDEEMVNRTIDGSRTRYSALEERHVTVDTPTA